MKTKSASWLILAAIALAAVFLFAPQPALAQFAAPDASDTTFLATSAPAPTPVVTVAPAPAWYLSTEFFAAIFSVIAGGVAIWQNKKMTTAEKVSASLIVAMEAASKIPEVAAHEKAIKAKLNEKLRKSGAQPVVERLLRGLT